MAVNAGQQTGPAGLLRVYPVDENTNTDIDIIAIHGLDTRSPDTWIWKDRGDAKKQVNWLQDSNMLPSIVGQARIFTCDWPADMFQKSIPSTLEESAQFLLRSIRQRLEQNKKAGKDRPVFFIASCLGGIILIKALEIDRHDGDKTGRLSLTTATRGIVFLATPFRGTAFKDMPDLTLKVWALFKDQTATALMDYTKEPTPNLDELVSRFFDLRRERSYHVFTFWEAHETSLVSKIYLAWLFSKRASWVCFAALFLSGVLFSPWLLVLCLLWRLVFPSCQPKQLVDKSSATAQIPEQQRLNRCHVLMNKFGDSRCRDYEQVANKIEEIVGKIREGTPLEKADAWIRDKHYTEQRLRIDRLSGDPLPMHQCYINLAIVEQSGQDAGHSKEGDAAASPFSLFARQKVETPNKTAQVELATIFNQRKGRDDRAIQPRRILIRGRAGVGKTTLCKKIIYEFTQGTWVEWSQLFDRVLWVPLRNLKLEERRREPGYDFARLFSHEYFTLPNNRPDLARELSHALETKNSKTLFLLDGLDEVSQDLTGDGSMPRFLTELLKQPNVIITSRPSAKPPPDLDLELETIGFYPGQVTEYLQMTFASSKADEVQSFLEKHWLIQGLVRIPIQLDALCYTWDDFDPGIVPDTMSSIYRAIERRLWKKDVVRLDKMSEGNARSGRPAEIEPRVETEIALLECLAFNGLHSDVIDFTPAYRDEIVHMLPLSTLSLDETLARLSFLRTSDSSSKIEYRNYHFIHLTFQEYFAARYFLRQRKHDKQLEYIFNGQSNPQSDTPTAPVKFLQKHKYTARYDIMWRFVAGLLDADGQAGPFIHLIEEEPLDLLGPTHQRLVMHCLSEISSDLPIRGDLEQRLSKWLLFECTFRHTASLASEVEFPELALDKAFYEGSEDTKRTILKSLTERATIPQKILKAVAARLEDQDKYVRSAALEALGGRSALPEEILKAVVARLEDEDDDVQRAAADALGRRPALPKEILQAVAARLEHQHEDVRRAAVDALGRRSALPEEILKAVATRLEDQHENIRYAAAVALGHQSALPEEILQAVAARLEHQHEDVRWAAAVALGRQSALPEEILQAVAARLEHEDEDVRWAAAVALGRQSALPEEILQAVAARLEHEDDDVRWAAADVLASQSALPKEILQAVAARLEHEDEDVQRAAADALASQSALPEEILKAVAARLEHQRQYVRRAAEAVLRRHAEFYRTLLNGPYVPSLYGILLQQSFNEQLSWYIDDGESCVNMSEDIRRLSIHNKQNNVRAMIKKARPTDFPSR
ncbi:peptidase C14 [Dactylonectria estremocensis]|uniref:Peptidase C14 n=1 Tax=Dactylonectria estremocensis TaxID=1079267 RepID=A0A9P9JCP1_9HYPO|nr:peptidase C14 [Dactylonectria estremocensis]